MLRKVLLLDTILAFIFIDQMSKWWIIEFYYKPRVFESEGATIPFLKWLVEFGQKQFPPAHIEITSFFNLVMVWNKGVSFGMFSSAHDMMPYILSGAALALVVGLFIWMARATHMAVRFPLAIIIAGALSNVWDRLRFGAVADFLDFHYQGWHYPAFNVADCCIVVGVIALAIDGLFIEPKRIKEDV